MTASPTDQTPGPPRPAAAAGHHRLVPVRFNLGVRVSRGQSTVEYALVLLGAAALALALVAWVSGSDVVGRLFDTVLQRILGQAA